MSVKGGDSVRRHFRKTIDQISGARTEKTVTQILLAAVPYAAAMTPVATSNLINSQYRHVEPTVNGYRGEVGYTANYAAYVHEAPGTLLGKGEPRYPRSLGNVWDPNAEPGFLRKAFEDDAVVEIQSIIKAGYKL